MRRIEDIPVGIKILAIIVLAVATGTGVLAGILSAYRENVTLDRNRERAGVIARGLSAIMVGPLAFGDPDGAEDLLGVLSGDASIVRAVVYSPDGRPFASRGSEAAPVLPYGGRARSVDGAENLRLFEPVVHDGERLGGVALTFSMAPLARQLRAEKRLTFTVTVLTILACAALGWRLRRVVTEPLERLSSTMSLVATRGDLRARAERGRADELGKLDDAFNAMLDQLEARQLALARSEERLRSLLRAIPDAVVVVDDEGRIVEVPSAGLSSLADRIAASVGRRVEDLLDGESASAVLRAIGDSRTSGLHESLPLVVRRGDEQVVYEASVGPISTSARDSMDAGLHVVVARDVTERHELQAQLVQAQKMEAVGQLAGGIAHDFNNLLGGIVGFAELLRLRAEDAQARQHADEILDIAARAAELVKNLLAFSRRVESKMAAVDLNDVADRVARIAKRTFDRGIAIELDLAKVPAMVWGDRAQLESAILNLVVNARDAMGDRGTLRIATRTAEGGPPPTTLRNEAGCEITVSDTGTGIAPEVRARMFDPFFTTKPLGKGSGLGLAAVYGTVKAHGGAIDVESTLGRGSSFRIVLPRYQGDQLAEAILSGEGERIEGTRILIVDDEAVVRETAKMLLEARGFDVCVADGGPSALAIVASTPTPFDVYIIDLSMPVMSGAEVSQKLRQLDPSARIVVSSGFDLRGDSDSGRPDADAFLTKPYRLKELVDVVERVAPAASRRRRP